MWWCLDSIHNLFFFLLKLVFRQFMVDSLFLLMQLNLNYIEKWSIIIHAKILCRSTWIIFEISLTVIGYFEPWVRESSLKKVKTDQLSRFAVYLLIMQYRDVCGGNKKKIFFVILKNNCKSWKNIVCKI